MIKTTVIAQQKKLKELTQNVMLPFTPAETVLNQSTTRLSDFELKTKFMQNIRKKNNEPILRKLCYRWTDQ